MSRHEAVPRIQFLSFDGCPLEAAARSTLERAMAEFGLKDYESIDVLHPDTPEEMRSWGSPTILVNGEDVDEHQLGDGVGCRVYDSEDGVPTQQSIMNAIRKYLSDG